MIRQLLLLIIIIRPRRAMNGMNGANGTSCSRSQRWKTYVERLVLGPAEHLVRALDLVRWVVVLVDRVERVRIVGARRIELDGARRRMELDAHLLLRWERRREVRRLRRKFKISINSMHSVQPTRYTLHVTRYTLHTPTTSNAAPPKHSSNRIKHIKHIPHGALKWFKHLLDIFNWHI